MYTIYNKYVQITDDEQIKEKRHSSTICVSFAPCYFSELVLQFVLNVYTPTENKYKIYNSGFP